jgi:hypothetical protein
MLIGLCLSLTAQAQLAQKKTLQAFRAQQPIVLDGKLNEPDWHTGTYATDFVHLKPTPGHFCKNQCRVSVLYDDTGIYVGAAIEEDNFEKIGTELFERDGFEYEKKIDWFEIILDCYQDGLVGYGFGVSASGVQVDVKYTQYDIDGGWDAVWDSEVHIDTNAWYCEMKIPYSALRFPNQPEQRWSVNFDKGSHQRQEESYWNPIDPEFDGIIPQCGVLEGICDIRPPVRLSATPFLAVYTESFSNPEEADVSWTNSYNAGMDVKYGLSDAYTMDMTLIPDFGQVQSDNQVLNLSPFEVYFDENRQFFTEGTELFNKAGLFYSRRVGDTSYYFDDVFAQTGDNERVAEIRSKSRLINATKISGRASNGLGIGFFNAISPRDHATIENFVTGKSREVLLQPWTNYNVMVFDQNLKHNSFVAIANSNVWREGSARDANATGIDFNLKDKANKYALYGSGAITKQVQIGRDKIGHRYFIGAERLSGNFNWSVGHNVESDTYDNNDLGFNNNNNERTYSASMEYNTYTPFGPFLNGGIGWHGHISSLYNYPGEPGTQIRPNLLTDAGAEIFAFAKFKNFYAVNAFFYTQPGEGYDYYEPRVPGRFFIYPAFKNVGLNVASDNRKKLIVALNARLTKFHEKTKHQLQYGGEGTYRINNHLTVGYEYQRLFMRLDRGYIDMDDQNIILGARDFKDIAQVIGITYTFSPQAAFSFRLRHNWTRVHYTHFYNLELDGRITERTYAGNPNVNFNAWTIDSGFRWRFAPGSDMYIVWKNAIFGFDDQSQISFGENLRALFDNPQSNSFSIKAIYYLDFQRL